MASALMLILMGGVLALTRISLESWNRHNERTQLTTRAESILDLLEADLTGALIRRSNDGQALFLIEPIDSENGSGKALHLRFYSNSAGSLTSAGSLRQVEWVNSQQAAYSPFIDQRLPVLYRITRDPETSWQLWLNQTQSTGFPPGLTLDTVESAENAFLTAYCVHFEVSVRFYGYDGTELSLPEATVRTLPHSSASSRGTYYLDISLGLIPAASANTLWGNERLSVEEEKAWLEKHTYLSHRRVVLRQSN